MSGPQILEVDPRELRLPTTRREGADPAKLHRQISRHGRSAHGMPPIESVRGSDGVLVINDGVTRATRIAKLSPGTLVPVVIIGTSKRPMSSLPTIKDKLP